VGRPALTRGGALAVAAAVAAMASLLGCGTGDSATPQAGGVPIFNDPRPLSTPSSGMVWTYVDSIVEPSRWPLPTSGVISLEYLGPATYRGSVYDETQEIDPISSDMIVVYSIWSDGFDEKAAANALSPPMPCASPPRSETILSAAADFSHAHSIVQGTAEYYFCGSPGGTLDWSLVTTAQAGTLVIGVPAGSFVVSTVTGVWKYGAIERDYTDYLYGNALVERKATQYNNGSFDGSFLIQLASGPTNVAIPGPSTLGADYW